MRVEKVLILIVGLGRKTACLSQPPNQLSSKFQDPILFVSTLNPSTQKNSRLRPEIFNFVNLQAQGNNFSIGSVTSIIMEVFLKAAGKIFSAA